MRRRVRPTAAAADPYISFERGLVGQLGMQGSEGGGWGFNNWRKVDIRMSPLYAHYTAQLEKSIYLVLLARKFWASAAAVSQRGIRL